MYYLHYVNGRSGVHGSTQRLYAVMTKSVKRQGAIVSAGFAEGPFRTPEAAMVRASAMNATLVYDDKKGA